MSYRRYSYDDRYCFLIPDEVGNINNTLITNLPGNRGCIDLYPLIKKNEERMNIEMPYRRYSECSRNPGIKNVIFNPPATIVFWYDGIKTVVKCGENETFDPEKGLAMAIAKRYLQNKGNYYNTFKKWLPKEDTKDYNGPRVCVRCKYFDSPVMTEPCYTCFGTVKKPNFIFYSEEKTDG